MSSSSHTPIAARFSTLSSAPSSSSLAPSDSLSTRNRTSSNRLSVQPGDDPFAATAPPAQESALPPPLGGEEWRISEEGSQTGRDELASSANGRPESRIGNSTSNSSIISSNDKIKLQRRPSFLRSLLRRPSSRSSLSVSSISSPVLSPTDPPRIGPIHSSASLVSLSDASQSRRNSYAVGEGSLRGSGSERARTPVYEVFGKDGAGGTRSLGRSSSLRMGLGLGIGANGEGGDKGEEEQRKRDSVAHPPTESMKAFEVLGGPRITKENRKGVERLTGELSLPLSIERQPSSLPLRLHLKKASAIPKSAWLLPPTISPPVASSPTTLASPSFPPLAPSRRIVRPCIPPLEANPVGKRGRGR